MRWQGLDVSDLNLHVEPSRQGFETAGPENREVPSPRQGMCSYVSGAGAKRPKSNLALTNALLSSLRIRQQMRKDIFSDEHEESTGRQARRQAPGARDFEFDSFYP